MKAMTGVITRSLLLNRYLSQSTSFICAIKRNSSYNSGLINGFARAFCTAAPSNNNHINTPVVSSDSLPNTVVATEEELQEEWKALERRVSNRKPRNSDSAGRSGRSKRNSSAWDAENA